MNKSTQLFSFMGISVLFTGHLVIGFVVWEYFSSLMPNWESLVSLNVLNEELKQNSINNWRKDNTVINNWGKYLVDDKKSEKWWRWSYLWFPNDVKDLSEDFRKVKRAWSSVDTNSDALNIVCGCAYKKNIEQVTNNYKRDIWNFCSLGGKELVTLKEVPWDNRRLKEIWQNKLISTQEKSNYWFWKFRNKEYEDIEETSFFGGFKNGKTIKEKCEAIYSLKEITNEQLKDTLKFCTIEPIPQDNQQ